MIKDLNVRISCFKLHITIIYATPQIILALSSHFTVTPKLLIFEHFICLRGEIRKNEMINQRYRIE